MGRLFRLPFPGPPLLAIAMRAVPLRPHLDDLRRQHPLHAGRRVQLLDQPLAGAPVLRGAVPRPGGRAPPRPGHGAPRAGDPLPRHPRVLRAGRRRGPRPPALRPEAGRLRGADPGPRVRSSPRSGRCRSCCDAATSPTWGGRSSRTTAASLLPDPTRWVLVLALVGIVLARGVRDPRRRLLRRARPRSSRSGSGSTPPRRCTSGTRACCPSTTCRSTCWRLWACRRCCDRSR